MVLVSASIVLDLPGQKNKASNGLETNGIRRQAPLGEGKLDSHVPGVHIFLLRVFMLCEARPFA